MFINAFKTNRVYLPFVIVVVTLLLWLDGFWYYREIAIPSEYPAPLYALILPFFETYKFLNVLLAFVFLITQAFVFNHIVTTKNLVDRHSFMPGFLYAILMSSSFDMFSFHPVLISNFFLIIVLDKIIDVFSEEKVYLEVFNVGLLVGLASLFYFPSIFFILLAIIALFVYYIASLRSIIANFLGFFTPFFFLGVFYHMTDQLDERLYEFAGMFRPFMVFNIELEQFMSIYLSLFAFIGFITIVTVYLSFLRDRPVRVRKRYNVFLYFFIISLISLLFVLEQQLIFYGTLNIYAAVILSCFFHSNKNRHLNELVFTLLFVFLILVKLDRFG